MRKAIFTESMSEKMFLTTGRAVCFYALTFRGNIKAWAEENGKHKEFQLRVLVLLLLCTGLPDA